jgi:hypothetical protein
MANKTGSEEGLCVTLTSGIVGRQRLQVEGRHFGIGTGRVVVVKRKVVASEG